MSQDKDALTPESQNNGGQEVDKDEVDHLFDDDPDEDLSPETDDDLDEDPDQDYEVKARAEREARRKAEAKIVAMKQAMKKSKSDPSKTDKGPATEDEDARIERKIAEIRFYEQNPEAVPLKAKISEYQKKWLTLDEAHALASRPSAEDAKRGENQKKSNDSRISGSSKSPSQSRYSLDELSKIAKEDPVRYNKIRDGIDAGKIVVS